MNNCMIGDNVKIINPVNIYDCILKDNVFIGPFVEIQSGVIIGKDSRISSHSFICSGVTIGDNCFIGHGVVFTNDKFDNINDEKWIQQNTTIGNNVKIGSNTTLLPVNIGNNVIIGAGTVVTKDISNNIIVCGNPARIISKSRKTNSFNNIF